MLNQNKSLSLMELIIALALMGLIILGINSINIFSLNHLLTADRRAKVQNEVSYVLECMTKEISRAIGNSANCPTNCPVSVLNMGTDIVLSARIDANKNGQSDSYPIDYDIVYWFDNTAHTIDYCNNSSGAGNVQCTETLSQTITSFNPTYNKANNYVGVAITGRWDPNQAVSPDNPEVSMSTSLNMPSVSTH